MHLNPHLGVSRSLLIWYSSHTPNYQIQTRTVKTHLQRGISTKHQPKTNANKTNTSKCHTHEHKSIRNTTQDQVHMRWEKIEKIIACLVRSYSYSLNSMLKHPCLDSWSSIREARVIHAGRKAGYYQIHRVLSSSIRRSYTPSSCERNKSIAAISNSTFLAWISTD